MTLAQTHAHGFGTPSLPQPLLTAMLRAFVELVLNVAATLRMRRRHGPVIGTQAMPTAPPRETHDTRKEKSAVQQDGASHTSPSPSVSHATRAIHLPLLRRWRQTALRRLRLRGIASTAFGGGGGSRRSRETEGASHAHPSLRSSRRKSGPRASRVMCVESGPHQQPWIPACAGMSGTRPATQAPN